MVQNLMSSAFETITTVQEGVEILDIFQHLSSREVTHFWKYLHCTISKNEDMLMCSLPICVGKIQV